MRVRIFANVSLIVLVVIALLVPAIAFAKREEFLDRIPRARMADGVPATENPAYALKKILQRSGGKIFGNWAVDMRMACISATRSKYIVEKEIKKAERAGRCGKLGDVIRVSR